MFAIVDIAGQQFKVEQNMFLYVNHLQQNEGESLVFDKILMISDGKGNVKVGTPYVSGAKISATLLQHLKDDKVIVFKKKRRKGYKRKRGHRQLLSKIQINSIPS